MNHARRAALLSLLASSLTANAQRPEPPIIHLPPPMPTGDSHAKSKGQIAEENREEALRYAEELVKASEQLRDELKKAGEYIVAVDFIKKTRQIEKLTRRIRALLKG
jgi:hypothetical protein